MRKGCTTRTLAGSVLDDRLQYTRSDAGTTGHGIHYVAYRRLVSDFDARWAAWRERGRLHDRVVRCRLTHRCAGHHHRGRNPDPVSAFFRWLWRAKAQSPEKPFRDDLLRIERLEERALALATSFTIDPSPRRRARDILLRFVDDGRPFKILSTSPAQAVPVESVSSSH